MHDANKLRISPDCLEALVHRYQIPPAFVFGLTRHYLPSGRGSRAVPSSPSARGPPGAKAYEYWYFLPLRIQVQIEGGARDAVPGESATLLAPPGSGGDAGGSGGGAGGAQMLPPSLRPPPHHAGQMNPVHSLRLPEAKMDIRRSHVGVFSRYDAALRRTTFVAVDFMHGRWPKVATEAQSRIAELMSHRAQMHHHHQNYRGGGVATMTTDHDDGVGYGHAPHLVYLTSAARWWTNALNGINEQLIRDEEHLQSQLDRPDITPASTLTDINRALHSIAAHLHRYSSELRSLQGTVAGLAAHFTSIHDAEVRAVALQVAAAAQPDDPAKGKAALFAAGAGLAAEGTEFENVARAFEQVQSQIDATVEFAQELEKKTENILALVSGRRVSSPPCRTDTAASYSTESKSRAIGCRLRTASR